jgi:hypothetical protein
MQSGHARIARGPGEIYLRDIVVSRSATATDPSRPFVQTESPFNVVNWEGDSGDRVTVELGSVGGDDCIPGDSTGRQKVVSTRLAVAIVSRSSRAARGTRFLANRS